MKIGLIDVDGHGKKKLWGATVYPNLALCKIAAWHKLQGDDVGWYDPMFGGHYDTVYCAKVFNFSPDYPYRINADTIIRGGTGYDYHSQLPKHIDDTQPDLSIYPNVPGGTSYGFLTRGCPNKCFWCVVPKKEGAIRPYWDIERVANGNRTIVLMDNNFLAAGDYAVEQLKKIISNGYTIDFNQALDARLVEERFAALLAKVKWIHSRIRFGCDTTAQIEQCQRAIGLLHNYGYRGEFFLYTMLGGKNDIHECYNRLTYWREKLLEHRKKHTGNAVYLHAQPFRDPFNPPNDIPQWQLDMASWSNKKMCYYTCDFKDFQPRKGFFCREYFL